MAVRMDPTTTDAVTHTDEKANILAQFEVILAEVPEDHFLSPNLIRPLLKNYSVEDLKSIYEDFTRIRELTFDGVDREKQYVATAGGPCAGKSTLLESVLGDGTAVPCAGKGDIKAAYIDPDRAVLFRMDSYNNDDRSRGDAYTHWRDASNFIANVFLAIGLKEGYAIAHGTTMTSPYTTKVLNGIRAYGYSTHMLHLSAPDQLRIDSEHKRRDGDVVQCTDQDLIDKGVGFFDRLSDYLNADRITFFYRGEMDTYAMAGEWRKDQGIKILDHTAMNEIIQLHDSKKGEGSWQAAFTPPPEGTARKV